MSNAALAAECVGGPHDGTLAVIGAEGEFPLKIYLRWKDGRVFYRRRHRPAGVGEGYVVYYEFFEEAEDGDLAKS